MSLDDVRRLYKSAEQHDLPNLQRLFEIDSNLRNYKRFIEKSWKLNPLISQVTGLACTFQEIKQHTRYVDFKTLWQLVEDTEPGGMEQFTKSYESFGINVQPDGSIYCREWCPAAEQLSLWGEFNDWHRTKHKYTAQGNGIWDLTIPAEPNGQCAIPHNSIIKLIVVNKEKHYHEVRVSPWARYVTQDEESDLFRQTFWNPPEVYRFKHDHPEKPDRLRIYEAHIGIASEEETISTYEYFTHSVLPRIEELGYNAVQLMAVTEHAYYASFGYQVTNFFAVSSRFGRPEQLKELIDVAHGKGLLVILDLIHSHASKNVLDGLNGFDGTEECFFHGGLRGFHELWDSRLFDYAKSEVLRFLLSNLRWWVEEYHFDGFRFDGVTSMLFLSHGLDGNTFTNYDDFFFDDRVDQDAGTYLMLANHLLKSLYPSFIVTIAEPSLGEAHGIGFFTYNVHSNRPAADFGKGQNMDVSGMPGLCRPIDEGGFGFDYRMSMAIPTAWVELLKLESDDEWNMGGIVWTLVNRRYKEKCIAYVECHDQSLVGDLSLVHRLIGVKIHSHMAIDAPTSTDVDRGMALLKLIRLITHSLGGEGYLNFIGNEFGHPDWLDFPREGNEESYLYARRQWSLVENKTLRFHFLNCFDRDLNHHEIEYAWLASEQAYISRAREDDKVIVYERAGLVFAFNFHPSNNYEDYRIGVQQSGRYKIILNSDDEKYGGCKQLSKTLEYVTSEGEWDKRNCSLLIFLPSRVGLILKHDGAL